MLSSITPDFISNILSTHSHTHFVYMMSMAAVVLSWQSWTDGPQGQNCATLIGSWCIGQDMEFLECSLDLLVFVQRQQGLCERYAKKWFWK